MNKIPEYITQQSWWILAFLPVVCVSVWFAIESRWEAYSRRKNYQELKILNALRREGAITQEEFDEKKEELLGA